MSVIAEVRDLRISVDGTELLDGLDFDIRRGEVFVIMGGSGCGKSTLLRHLIGLKEPAEGEIWYGSTNFTAAPKDERDRVLRLIGNWHSQFQHGFDIRRQDFLAIAPRLFLGITSGEASVTLHSRASNDPFDSVVFDFPKKRVGFHVHPTPALPLEQDDCKVVV